jgi:hypothetical protein
MMWCPLILAHDVDLEDDGVWQGCFCSRVMFLHIHRWSLFFGGLRCCDSMGDKFFISDSG